MSNTEFKHGEITSQIIKCAMDVHKILGCGFQEVIYQRALAIEFDNAKLNYYREHEMTIFYKDKPIGTRRVDFFVENVISVELKALAQLDKTSFTQAINYLEIYNIEIGMLINFGRTIISI